jgi:hypothetical protein
MKVETRAVVIDNQLGRSKDFLVVCHSYQDLLVITFV